MILVTGGTGLLGSHLLMDLAKRDERVRALKRDSSDLSVVKKNFSRYCDQPEMLFSKIEWANGDVLDYLSLTEAMEGVMVVYHCAAMISYNPAERKTLLKNNIRGTANVVNACLEKKIEKLCHVSSIAAIGVSLTGELIDEEHHWQPATNSSAYTLSKFYSEMEVWRGISEGLSAVVVNPSIILGSGDGNKGSSRFFSLINRGMRYYTAGAVGFVDVRDVCRAMIRLMDSPIVNERFIISAENLTYRELFNMIADSLGKPRPEKLATPFMTAIAWRYEKIKSLLTGIAPSLTKENARTGHKSLCYSNNKITLALNMKFIPVKDTVMEVAESFLDKE